MVGKWLDHELLGLAQSKLNNGRGAEEEGCALLHGAPQT